MTYKLLAADMDGTLLNDDSLITEGTARAVKQAEAAGACFVISTGRAPQGVQTFLRQLELRGPVICYNGAMIVRADTGEVLYEQSLDREDARRILQLGHRWGITMCIWAGNRLYGSPLNERVYRYRNMLNVETSEAPEDEVLLDIGITKILWYDTPERIQALQQDLASVRFDCVNYCTSKPFYLEFFSGKASKAGAMERIGELYGIRREEMIAVGDGENDLSMLSYAGLGIAMGNATDHVKSAADCVTGTNEEEGVRQVIEKFLLPTSAL